MFVHCHAHVLNLVVCDSAEVSNLARDTFALLKRLYAFFSTSPKRHGVYEKYVQELCRGTEGRKLLQLSSATRWTARSDNLEAVHNCLPAIVVSLMEIEQCHGTTMLRLFCVALGSLFLYWLYVCFVSYCCCVVPCQSTCKLLIWICLLH